MSYDGIYVRIKKGTYRNPPHDRPVIDKVFPLQKPFYTGVDKRTKVNVYGSAAEGLEDRICRIFCSIDDIQYIDKDGNEVDVNPDDCDGDDETSSASEASTSVDYEKLFLQEETEEQAMERIRGTFKMFDDIVEAVCAGTIRGLIVCGPPGVGKSFGVDKILGKHSMFKKLKDNGRNYEIVKGFASPISIYKTLYNFSAKDQVVVFDDCDDAMKDDTALNILKAALDSGDRRTLCWLSESRVLREEDIPPSFDFCGSAIFLTNYDFERTTSPRLKAHMDAMMSRCHYLDLELSTQRDRLLRIKQIVGDGMLKSYELTPEAEAQVVQYIFDNADYMRELSLRMVKKIADFRKAMPDRWEEFAESTCLKRTAKFQRLYQQLKQNGVDGQTSEGIISSEEKAVRQILSLKSKVNQ